MTEMSVTAKERAKAYVRGFQNDEAYVMSTLKHYAGYGACVFVGANDREKFVIIKEMLR